MEDIIEKIKEYKLFLALTAKMCIRDSPETRQTLLFSATMPEAIKRIGVQFMKEPEHVKICLLYTSRCV